MSYYLVNYNNNLHGITVTSIPLLSLKQYIISKKNNTSNVDIDELISYWWIPQWQLLLFHSRHCKYSRINYNLESHDLYKLHQWWLGELKAKKTHFSENETPSALNLERENQNNRGEKSESCLMKVSISDSAMTMIQKSVGFFLLFVI